MATIRPYRSGWRAEVRRAGQKSSKTFPSKQEAQRWAREQEHAIDRHGAVSPELRLTLAELIDYYVEHLLPARCSPSRRRQLLFVRRRLGHYRLRELTVAVLVAYARRRQSEGAAPPTVAGDLSYLGLAIRHAGAVHAPVDTLNRHLATLRTAKEILGHGKVVGPSRKRTRRPTEAELARLRDHFEGSPWLKTPMWRLVRFAVATTLREGEIAGLRWADLDASKRLLLVRNRKHPTSKDANDGVIPLVRHTSLCGEELDPLALILEQRGLDPVRIFPYNAATISTAFCRAVRCLRIADLRFHDLRHEAISRMFESGFDIPQVAVCSGHKDWKSLKIYTQINPQTLLVKKAL